MDRVSTLLAQFPGPVRLPATKWVSLCVLAVGAIFAAGTISESGLRVIASWSGLLGTLFFILCMGAAAVSILPGASEIVLDQDGVTACELYQRRHWRWTEIGDFALVPDSLMPLKRVGFNFKGADSGTPAKASEQSGELPPWRSCVLRNSYGLRKDDCVRLLSPWQQRAFADAR